MRLVFDIETNGLLDSITKVHCIVAKDIDTQEVYSYRPTELKAGVDLLLNAKQLIGHNIQDFDIPALEQIFKVKFENELVDTLLISRLIWTDIKDKDFRDKVVPSQLIGKHSLDAWGYRLGKRKGDYIKTHGFEEWTEEMQSYCENDVEVTYLFYLKILQQRYSSEAIDLEHKFAYWIRKQERQGVNFDLTSAEKLFVFLTKKRLELEQQLTQAFPPIEKHVDTLVPKRDNKKLGYKKGVPVKKFKLVEFNPNSRDHIAERLILNYQWKPQEFTPTGKPEINERILNKLTYPEAKLLAEHFMLQKRLGQLSDGEQSYLKLVTKENKIHGKIITNGAVTGRCTANSPNLQQVVSSSSPYGKELRSLFTAPHGFVMLGIDFSGLELRVLGHYLHSFDNGQFIKILLESDIHTANQQAVGLDTRNQAKTFIYAYIYGAGNEKLGLITGGNSKEGKRLRDNFEKKLPALKYLKQAVSNAYHNKKFLRGLDSRKLMCRSEHSALNTLIQSAGAIIVKKGTVLLNEKLHKNNFVWGEDYAMVLHVHDEMQFIVKKDRVDEFKTIAESIFDDTQVAMNFRCKLDGEIKVGQNWSETH